MHSPPSTSFILYKAERIRIEGFWSIFTLYRKHRVRAYISQQTDILRNGTQTFPGTLLLSKVSCPINALSCLLRYSVFHISFFHSFLKFLSTFFSAHEVRDDVLKTVWRCFNELASWISQTTCLWSLQVNWIQCTASSNQEFSKNYNWVWNFNFKDKKDMKKSSV